MVDEKMPDEDTIAYIAKHMNVSKSEVRHFHEILVAANTNPRAAELISWINSGKVSVRTAYYHFRMDEIRVVESQIEEALCKELIKEGHTPHRQVLLESGGIVDVLTNEGIFEIKAELTRKHLFTAVGQLILYSTELGRLGDPLYIVGFEARQTQALRPVIEQLGINLILWRWEVKS